jgi:peptide/nickel transport system permease protein
MAARGFASFAASKLIAAVITILAITCVNFVIFRMAPGDPIRMMFRDPRVSAEQMQKVREKFGLDKPLSGQFVAYVKELAKGDLGISFWQKRPVLEVIGDRVPQTLILVITALVIAVVLGTLFGAMAGWRSGTRFDSIVMSASLALYSIPTFAMGLLILLVFSFLLAVFPLGGISTPASGFTGIRQVLDVLWHMVLPAISIVFWYVGEYVLLTRSSMIDVLGKEYITTARAKGLKEGVVLRGHALRNALLPVVTMTGVNFAFAIGGVIEAETVFSWPGVGRLVYDAVLKRDYPLLQGIFLVFAVSVVLFNLIVDLVYGYIDPRIKVGGERKVG